MLNLYEMRGPDNGAHGGLGTPSAGSGEIGSAALLSGEPCAAPDRSTGQCGLNLLRIRPWICSQIPDRIPTGCDLPHSTSSVMETSVRILSNDATLTLRE